MLGTLGGYRHIYLLGCSSRIPALLGSSATNFSSIITRADNWAGCECLCDIYIDMAGEEIIDVHRSDSSVSKAHDSFYENIERKDEVGSGSAAVGGEQTQVSETPTLWMWVLTFVSGISGVFKILSSSPYFTC